jgi:HlyD family secretion protein
MARDRLSDLSPHSPADAVAEDVFFKPGEWVAAGQPVVSLLEPSGVTIRFFLPQAAIARAPPGTTIRFHCDGCSGVKTATISYVASEPEFTPPVIYSEGARAKLVYLVEAKPAAADGELRPGMPVSVEPLP